VSAISGNTGPDSESDWSEPMPEAIEASADRIINGERTPEFDHLSAEIAFVCPETVVPESKLAFLLKYWAAIREAEGRLPIRKDIDVLELRQAIGNIMMLDVLDEGFDARYRVYGTGVVEYAGHDWTGATLSEMCRKTRTPLALLYRACYLAVYRTGRPIYTESMSPSWLAPKAWRRMILPYADEQGACVGFMVGNIPVEPRTKDINPKDAANSLMYRNR
jgi:PAS domain-containing protein